MPSVVGAQQLQRKLVWFFSGWLGPTSMPSTHRWTEVCDAMVLPSGAA
jgi:hypothetical protein